MHYYQFNIGDYSSHTAHLDLLEDLAYRRMLDWCYLHERPLPDDIEQIGKLIRMRSHSDCIASVLQEFFVRTAGGWWKDRIGEEIAVANEKREKAKASANARWSKEKGDANALRPESEGNAPNTQDPLPKTQDTRHKKDTSVEPQSVSPPAIEIPILGDKVFGVSEQMVQEWSKAYPAVNVMLELGKMRAWALSNPSKKKTANGIMRFINAWLSKAQDQGGSPAAVGFKNQGDRNAEVLQGLTRGLVGGGSNVKLLGN